MRLSSLRKHGGRSQQLPARQQATVRQGRLPPVRAARPVELVDEGKAAGQVSVADAPAKPSLTPSPSKRLKRQVTLRKITRLSSDDISSKVHAVILAGGSQDNPLARFRAMPAMEIGANAQLIDVPISNCIRSGINKIYVLTQFNSHQLNTHVSQAYPPVALGSPKRQGFVDVLAAHQTPSSSAWYAGSADAVRRNLGTILEQHRGAGVPDELIIISGEAIYQMDFSEVIRRHREMDADITLCSCTVGRERADQRGLVRVDPSTDQLLGFAEKPSGAQLEEMAHASRNATSEKPFEANMGIYVFNKDVLVELLSDSMETNAKPENHFGHHILPRALREDYRIMNYHFDKYWRPLSSLRDFFEVNLDLSKPGSPVGIYQADETIVSRGHIAPPSTIHSCELVNTLVGEGSCLIGSRFHNCVIGCNSFVGDGSSLTDCLLMGSDNYTNAANIEKALQRDKLIIGIGPEVTARNVIVDRNAAIGRGVQLVNRDKVKEADRTADGFVITDGIITVLNGAIIQPGLVV